MCSSLFQCHCFLVLLCMYPASWRWARYYRTLFRIYNICVCVTRCVNNILSWILLNMIMMNPKSLSLYAIPSRNNTNISHIFFHHISHCYKQTKETPGILVTGAFARSSLALTTTQIYNLPDLFHYFFHKTLYCQNQRTALLTLLDWF